MSVSNNGEGLPEEVRGMLPKYFVKVPFKSTFYLFLQINPKNIPCSLEMSGSVPLVPKTPGRPSMLAYRSDSDSFTEQCWQGE